MTFIEKIKETAAFLKSQGIGQVDFGLILGSGLGELADEIQDVFVLITQISLTGGNQLLLAMPGN